MSFATTKGIFSLINFKGGFTMLIKKSSTGFFMCGAKRLKSITAKIAKIYSVISPFMMLNIKFTI